MANTQEEMEGLIQKQRQLKEELAERDGQLRVVHMNLDTAQKQNQLHMQEVCNFFWLFSLVILLISLMLKRQ